MDDTDGWLERIREIHADGVTWWWYHIYIYIYECVCVCVCVCVFIFIFFVGLLEKTYSCEYLQRHSHTGTHKYTEADIDVYFDWMIAIEQFWYVPVVASSRWFHSDVLSNREPFGIKQTYSSECCIVRYGSRLTCCIFQSPPCPHVLVLWEIFS